MDNKTRRKMENNQHTMQVRAMFGDNQDGYERFRKAFEEQPKVREMRLQVQALQKSLQYIPALKLAQRIDEIELKAATNLLRETQEQGRKVSLISQKLPSEDLEKIVDMSIGIDVCCDIIETYCMDINDLLRKTDKDLSYEEMLGTVALLKKVRERLSFLAKHSRYRDFEPWGDECDKAAKYVLGKVKVIKRETAKLEAVSKPNDPKVGRKYGRDKKDGEQA